jgi:hypothetical protein
MASCQVIANSSAIAARTKRTILEQECLRRMRNFGVSEPWASKAMEIFNVDMAERGYPEGYREYR